MSIVHIHVKSKIDDLLNILGRNEVDKIRKKIYTKRDLLSKYPLQINIAYHAKHDNFISKINYTIQNLHGMTRFLCLVLYVSSWGLLRYGV